MIRSWIFYLLLFSCLGRISNIQAQISRFREYRELIVQAEFKVMQEDIGAAYDLYQQAYRSHGYLMARDLSNAALTASIRGEYVECALLMRELIRLGVPLSEMQQKPEFDIIWKNPASNQIMSKADEYSENGKKYRNARYLKSLDSLNILKDWYLAGNEKAGIQMAEGLLEVFNMWGMPGENYTGVLNMAGASQYDGIITLMAEGSNFSKYHARLSKVIRQLVERGCLYPDKTARWMEAMSKKKILSPQTATDDKTREKVRNKYILPPANLEYLSAKYREEHPESSFIFK
jgi:hypothetical protein